MTIHVHQGGQEDPCVLECWAGTRDDMPAVVVVCEIAPGQTWDELARTVREHQAEHLCGEPED